MLGCWKAWIRVGEKLTRIEIVYFFSSLLWDLMIALVRFKSKAKKFTCSKAKKKQVIVNSNILVTIKTYFVPLFQINVWIHRSSHQRYSSVKLFWKHAANLQENTHVKVQFQWRSCNVIEIAVRHACSSVNLLYIFGTPFYRAL